MKKSYFRIVLAAMFSAVCAMAQAAAPPIAADSPLAVAYAQVESKQAPSLEILSLKSEAPALVAKSTAITRRMWASTSEPCDQMEYDSLNGLHAERQGSIRHRYQAFT